MLRLQGEKQNPSSKELKHVFDCKELLTGEETVHNYFVVLRNHLLSQGFLLKQTVKASSVKK